MNHSELTLFDSAMLELGVQESGRSKKSHLRTIVSRWVDQDPSGSPKLTPRDVAWLEKNKASLCMEVLKHGHISESWRFQESDKWSFSQRPFLEQQAIAAYYFCRYLLYCQETGVPTPISYCEECGSPFVRKPSHRKYCARKCLKAVANRKFFKSKRD